MCWLQVRGPNWLHCDNLHPKIFTLNYFTPFEPQDCTFLTQLWVFDATFARITKLLLDRGLVSSLTSIQYCWYHWNHFAFSCFDHFRRRSCYLHLGYCVQWLPFSKLCHSGSGTSSEHFTIDCSSWSIRCLLRFAFRFSSAQEYYFLPPRADSFDTFLELRQPLLS